MIYFDNAASSWPKPAGVIRAARAWFGRNGANPGRSPHRPGRTASRAIRETRQRAAALLGGVDPDRIVFTSNATHALNIALKGLLDEGDHVVTSVLEHNSVLRPLHQLRAERAIDFTAVEPEADGRLAPEAVVEALRPGTRLVALSHGSNVLGTVQPVDEIARAVREARGTERGREEVRGAGERRAEARGAGERRAEIHVLVDAAQTGGVLDLPVREWGIDLLTLAGQKGLFGLQGTGVLYVGEGVELRPFVTGGTGSRSDEPVHPREMPDRLEAGTTNTPGVVALGAGLRFLEATGPEAIGAHEEELGRRLRRGLGEVEGVAVYGPDDAELAVVSFNVGRADPERIAFELDRRHGFAVRPGVHCAPWTHRWLGTLEREPQGAIRASPGYFNDEGEIDEFVAAVDELARVERERGGGRVGRAAGRGAGASGGGP